MRRRNAAGSCRICIDVQSGQKVRFATRTAVGTRMLGRHPREDLLIIRAAFSSGLHTLPARNTQTSCYFRAAPPPPAGQRCYCQCNRCVGSSMLDGRQSLCGSWKHITTLQVASGLVAHQHNMCTFCSRAKCACHIITVATTHHTNTALLERGIQISLNLSINLLLKRHPTLVAPILWRREGL